MLDGAHNCCSLSSNPYRQHGLTGTSGPNHAVLAASIKGSGWTPHMGGSHNRERGVRAMQVMRLPCPDARVELAKRVRMVFSSSMHDVTGGIGGRKVSWWGVPCPSLAWLSPRCRRFLAKLPPFSVLFAPRAPYRWMLLLRIFRPIFLMSLSHSYSCS